MKRHHNNRAGFTLTELVLVLFIASIVLGGIWAAAVNVRNRGHVDDAVSAMQEIASNVRNVYSGFPNAARPNAAEQITRGLFPDSTLNENRTATLNPWGGTYQITFVPAAGPMNGFWVQATIPATIDAETSISLCAQAVQLAKATGTNHGNRASVEIANPPYLESQGEYPTNAVIDNVDMTGKTPTAIINTAPANCGSLYLYYPF